MMEHVHGAQMNDLLMRRIDRRKWWVHILGAHWESGLGQQLSRFSTLKLRTGLQ